MNDVETSSVEETQDIARYTADSVQKQFNE